MYHGFSSGSGFAVWRHLAVSGLIHGVKTGGCSCRRVGVSGGAGHSALHRGPHSGIVWLKTVGAGTRTAVCTHMSLPGRLLTVSLLPIFQCYG